MEPSGSLSTYEEHWMSLTVQVTFDCADPAALSQFWNEVLGYQLDSPPPPYESWEEALDAWDIPEENRNDASASVDPDGNGPRLWFQKVPEGKAAKNRVHLAAVRVVEEALDAWKVPEEKRNDASASVDPDGAGPRLFFQKVPEGKSAKNRVHLDVRAAPGLEGDARMAALEAKCAELVALGATRLRRLEPTPMEAGTIVMQDPEGNEFCLD